MMRTYEKLVDLERALREKTVLSVYLNRATSDPATRDRWSVELRHSFDDIDSWLRGSSHSEREAFAACREMALKELSAFPPNERARMDRVLHRGRAVVRRHTSRSRTDVGCLEYWSVRGSLRPRAEGESPGDRSRSRP